MNDNKIKKYNEMIYSSRPVKFTEYITNQYDKIHDELYTDALNKFLDDVSNNIDKFEQFKNYSDKKDIIEKSLTDYGAVIVCNNLSQAIDFANELAPEHLELCVKNPVEYIGRVDNAGSVFLGNYSPESVGDYYAGPNHVLPTGGTARFFSPLSVDSFIKKSSFIYYTSSALDSAKDNIITLADAEGLTAHANAVAVRFK